MKKIHLLLIFLPLLSLNINAQKLSEFSINATGGSMSNANQSLLFTVGDIFVLPTDSNQTSSGLIGVLEVSEVITSLESSSYNLVKVYPNPAQDKLIIKSPVDGIQSLLLSDSQGKVLINRTLNKTSDLTLAELPKGLYLLKLVNSQGQIVKTYKIIKQ